MAGSVIDALRRFLPRLQQEAPLLCEARRRAVWALTHCRTATMGGHLHACADCSTSHYAYHSCNHRACPQCGGAATAAWVATQLERRVSAPYFLVTFTLPQELRSLFFGEGAREAFDLLFAASSRSLGESLASRKGLGAARCGFTSVLHTWNQRLQFHPHVHCLVPGAGLDSEGSFVRIKNENFLAPLPPLRARFRHHFRAGLEALGWQADPKVWHIDWGVHIQPCGNGAAAVKYLGAYVSRTAIGDARIVSTDEDTVTFRWKDRARGGASRTETLAGREFCIRYLRHVLPRGLRSIRHFGFHHPAAKVIRERVGFLSGRVLVLDPGIATAASSPPTNWPLCPCCQKAMRRMMHLPSAFPRKKRGPPCPA